MTETLPHLADPFEPAKVAEPSTRQVLRASSLAALRAAGVGLLLLGAVVLLAWATGDRTSAAVDAVRAAGQLWLLAHGVTLDVPDGRFGLTPLGLSAVALALLVRAGARAAEECLVQTARGAACVAVAVAVPYALLATAVAALSATGAVRAGLLQALLGGLVLGLLGAAAGAVRARVVGLHLPGRICLLARAVGVASGVLVAGGALLVGVSLALHLGPAAQLAGAGNPGPVGGAALLLAGLSLAPNAALWGASWLAGPGFAVGVGTSVGPFGYELGPVPALPLLAALPESGVPSPYGLLALLLPLAAGVLAGRMVLRDKLRVEGGSAPSLAWSVHQVVAVGPACGLLWVVLAWLSGGPVGGARLMQLGPAPGSVGLAIATLVSCGALAAVLLERRRS